MDQQNPLESGMLQPNKAIEFIAASLPVFSTEIPGLQGLFPEHLSFANTSQTFVEKLKQAIEKSKQLAHLSELQKYSWEPYIESIMKNIRKKVAI
jgi:hypothetical protein